MNIRPFLFRQDRQGSPGDGGPATEPVDFRAMSEEQLVACAIGGDGSWRS